MTKLLISSVWNKILKISDALFELIQIEAQCTKNYFKISWSQEAAAFGNNIEKESQMPHSKLKKYILNIYRGYLLYPQSNASGSFFASVYNFVEQQLKFSHFESSIISYAD